MTRTGRDGNSPASQNGNGSDLDHSATYRSHHWDRRSCMIAVVLLLFFVAAGVAVWSTLTTDHGPDVEFIVTPTPTEDTMDDTTETPTS